MIPDREFVEERKHLKSVPTLSDVTVPQIAAVRPQAKPLSSA